MIWLRGVGSTVEVFGILFAYDLEPVFLALCLFLDRGESVDSISEDAQSLHE